MTKIGEPKVVLVITNYNGASIFYRSKPILWHVLDSVRRTNYGNYATVFSDDSSTDKSIRYVKSNFRNVKITINKPNGGYTKTANNGIKYALRNLNPDYILLLNNDVIIEDKDWLRKLVEVAETQNNYGIVGPKFLYPNGRLQQAGITQTGPLARNRGWNTNDAKKYNQIEEVKALGSVVHLIKRKVIKKIGLLDENFFQGSDDIEYCLRASKAGFKIIYVGTTSVKHLEGFTAKKVSNTKGPDYWFPIFQINNMYLALKQFSKLQIFETIIILLLSSVIGIGNRRVSILSINFKNKPLWRLGVSIRAVFIGYNLYKGKITRKEAYGL